MDVCEPPTHEDSTLPISTDEFESLMAPLFGKEARGLSFGVALSGGADSLALTMLLHQWITQRGGSLQALTVDHGLRQDSDQEALEVALWLKRLGIAHTILTIPPWDPKSRIQEHARAHRHHLLATYCSAYNLRYLFFGHHIQDQWETFLHRLAHKSGLDGLTCMSPLSRTSFGFKCRPLLDVPKQRLVATLKTCKLSHMEDPSNRDPRFHRSKIRDKAQALTDLGLTPEAINGTLHKLRKVRESLDTIVASAFEATTMIFPLGYATVDLLKLQTFPREITRRLFEDLSLRVSPNPYPPRSGSFDSILDCLYPKPSPLAFINSDGGLPEIEEMVEKNHPPRTWSIQGTLFFVKNSVLWIMRAPCRKKTPPPLAPLTAEPHHLMDYGRSLDRSQCALEHPYYLWDNRFLLGLPKAVSTEESPPFKIAPLGKRGVLLLKKQQHPLDLIPNVIYETLPALWNQDQLISVPNLNFGLTKWREQSFGGKVPQFIHGKVN